MDSQFFINKALYIVKENLEFYIEINFKEIYGEKYILYLNNSNEINNDKAEQMIDYVDLENNYRKKFKDVSYFINLFLKYWDGIFKKKIMQNYVLSLVHSIRHFRNKWAHQDFFSFREVYRLVDECQSLLEELFPQCENTCIEYDVLNNLRLSALEALVYSEMENKNNSNKNNFHNNLNVDGNNRNITNSNNDINASQKCQQMQQNYYYSNANESEYQENDGYTNSVNNNFSNNNEYDAMKNYQEFSKSNNINTNCNYNNYAYGNCIGDVKVESGDYDTNLNFYGKENNDNNNNHNKYHKYSKCKGEKSTKYNSVKTNCNNSVNFQQNCYDKEMLEYDKIRNKNQHYNSILQNNLADANNNFNVYVHEDDD